jgi:hypothetical protein
MKIRFVSLLASVWFCLAALAAEPRWVSVEGHKLRAGFAGVSGDRVNLILDGKPLPVLLSRLAPASREQAAQLKPEPAPVPLHRWDYLDEISGRQVCVRETAPGLIEVVVFASSGGSFFRWAGSGSRSEDQPAGDGKKERGTTMLTFSQVVGEGGERGTLFSGLESANGSKLEIRFAEGESEPQDAGINGVYGRITADKALALSKKQFKTVSAALQELWRVAPRSWPGANRRVAGEWEARWPILRADWAELVFPAAGFVSPAEARVLEPHLDYWLALSEATGMGWGLIAYGGFEQPAIDGWAGEYDDGFGGHVSLREVTGGALSFALGCARGRGEDPQTAEFAGRIPVAGLAKQGGSQRTAVFVQETAGLPEGVLPMKISFRKFPHFLVVQTENAGPHTAPAWFDGVYRWSPAPVE